MKRLGLVLAGLALAGAVNTADAQLTMQMGNGWSATFAGNINAFWIYTDVNSKDCAAGDCTTVDGAGTKVNGIGTGLLPAFFTFDAKGTEGPVTLGAHVGFAPQVTMGRNVSSSFGVDAAGAQIDMRQVYGTVGGKWGQILFGKELGVFLRQNILTDLTLFGAGPLVLLPDAGLVNPDGTRFPRGTALGRIGYGYLYTDFRAQFTYSTPSDNNWGLAIGVFEPITVGNYTYGDLPRLEAEFTYKFGGENLKGSQFFISGAYGHAKYYAKQPPLVTDNPGLSSTGVGGGVKVAVEHFSFVGSGFYASGMGTTFMGDAYLGGSIANLGATDVLDNARSSYGYNLQAQYTGGKFSIGASYGGNYLNLTSDDEAAILAGDGSEFDNRTAIVGQLTYNWTKSLRVVGEYTYAEGKITGLRNDDTLGTVAKQTASQIALGMMLFY
ncbi:MAG: hypothetical protein H6Q77_1629 [Gemmatimonadetes bacterium]|nr:hypothetical protein [Gemmatimonadota bacterium]